MCWNIEKALKIKKAETRDGREVFNLEAVTINGKEALIGDVATIKRRSYKARMKNKPDGFTIPTEAHYWDSLSGMGGGDDDLVNGKAKYHVTTARIK